MVPLWAWGCLAVSLSLTAARAVVEVRAHRTRSDRASQSERAALGHITEMEARHVLHVLSMYFDYPRLRTRTDRQQFLDLTPEVLGALYCADKLTLPELEWYVGEWERETLKRRELI